jgi:Recombinase zinc beta ribbon domain/Recombinase
VSASGRKRFYDLAVAAEYESDLRSERLRLKHAELAAEGKWEGGMRNFGYDLEPYPDLASGRVKYRLVPNPTEAQALEAAAKEVIAGRSHTAIAIAWNKQGVTTTQGKPFTPQKVRDLLLSPKTAGLRYVEGKPVTADWLGIITPDQHQELRAILGPTSRERRGTGLPTARTYLLGGLVRCGRCGHRLTAKRRNGKRRYWCDTRKGGCGGLLRVAEPLERHVVWHLLSRLPERLLGAAKRAPEEWATLGRLMTQRQTQEDRLEGLADYLADGTLDRGEYLRQKKRLQARLATWMPRSPVSALVPHGDGCGGRPWRSCGLSGRRWTWTSSGRSWPITSTTSTSCRWAGASASIPRPSSSTGGATELGLPGVQAVDDLSSVGRDGQAQVLGLGNHGGQEPDSASQVVADLLTTLVGCGSAPDHLLAAH